MTLKNNKQYNRSPFFYVGDKYKLMSQLNENFPKEINRFIEPFCGGGSVFLNVKANKYLVNDIDTNMINLHKMLVSYSENVDAFWQNISYIINKYDLSAKYLGKTVPDELKNKYKKTYFAKYNKKAYIEMRNKFNEDKNNMMLLYLLLIYGFNRMLRFNRNGDFNLPVGNVDFNENVVKALTHYFEYVLNLDIKFYNMDFIDFIEQTQPKKGDFIYLDPPYLITTSEYNKLWDEDSEMRLINYLDELDAKGILFAVSNVLYHRQRYNGTFNKWAKKYKIIEIESNYKSYHDNTKKDSVEVLVRNY